MVNQRWRPALFALSAVVCIWVLTIAGYLVVKNSKMTAEKLQAYVESVDLRKLSGAERAKAIQRLAVKLNALSPEERRKARIQPSALSWFEQMSEEEKSSFIDATMPAGFKQMLSSFEQLPEERRRKAIDDALRELKQTRERLQSDGALPDATNAPAISKELEAKIRSIGLKTFYSQSSAQTKAELAPVLEELQHTMESGRPFRGR
jgi:hypothetical protein